jgi:hypothetical protein
MKLPFSLYIALKYLRPKRSFLSVVTVLSVLGVLLGVAVLIVVLSVMNGFDEMWRDKILGFNAHLTIMDYPTLEADKDWIRDLERIEGVTGAAPYIQGLAFLNHNDAVFSPFLRGIDPDLEKKISQVPLHMLEGTFSVEDEGLLLGADLAARMGIRVGDVVLVSSPQSFAKADAIRLPEEMTVQGIFRLDMFDFDVGYALCSLSSARSLFGVPSGVHGVQVMTNDPERAPFTKQRLEEALGPRYDIRTWMEMKPFAFRPAPRGEKRDVLPADHHHRGCRLRHHQHLDYGGGAEDARNRPAEGPRLFVGLRDARVLLAELDRGAARHGLGHRDRTADPEVPQRNDGFSEPAARHGTAAERVLPVERNPVEHICGRYRGRGPDGHADLHAGGHHPGLPGRPPRSREGAAL